MTADERAELEALAERVCPHTYRGLPCEREAHDDSERHWSAGAIEETTPGILAGIIVVRVEVCSLGHGLRVTATHRIA